MVGGKTDHLDRLFTDLPLRPDGISQITTSATIISSTPMSRPGFAASGQRPAQPLPIPPPMSNTPSIVVMAGVGWPKKRRVC